MHITCSIDLDELCVRDPHARICASLDRVWILHGDRALAYRSKDLVPEGEVVFPLAMDSICCSDSQLVGIGRAGCFASSDFGEAVSIDANLWSDPYDRFCVKDGTFWAVSSDAELVGVDLERRVVRERVALGAGWGGGSFSTFAGTTVVAVAVGMDARRAIYDVPSRTLVDASGDEYPVGLWGNDLVCSAADLIVLLPSGREARRFSSAPFFTSSAEHAGGLVLFGPDGMFALNKLGVEHREMKDGTTRTPLHGCSVRGAVLVTLREGALVRIEGL